MWLELCPRQEINNENDEMGECKLNIKQSSIDLEDDKEGIGEIHIV